MSTCTQVSYVDIWMGMRIPLRLKNQLYLGLNCKPARNHKVDKNSTKWTIKQACYLVSEIFYLSVFEL